MEEVVQESNRVPTKPRPWLGVLASFLVSGAAQYLNDRKAEGVLWFVGLHGLQFASAILLATSGIDSAIPGLVACVTIPVLWLVILARSYRPLPRVKALHWIFLAALFILIPYAQLAIVRQLVWPFYVPTGGMEPTIRGESQRRREGPKDGDYVMVARWAYWFTEPKRGDVIVFWTEGLRDVPQGAIYVQRVVGLPGDKMSIRAGKVWNGDRPVEPVTFMKAGKYANSPTGRYLKTEVDVFEVPPGQYFVLGDNTNNSLDSRYWGAISADKVIGQARKIYWPLERSGRIR